MITDLNLATSSINSIVAGFDGFEYYMYFESGSTLTSSLEYNITPYPKTGYLLPYNVLNTGSAKVKEWYSWATSSADGYDDNNQKYEVINTLNVKQNYINFETIEKVFNGKIGLTYKDFVSQCKININETGYYIEKKLIPVFFAEKLN
jgi:hypothetical protein